MKAQIYKDKANRWRWRIKASNGEILAHGQSYSSKRDAFLCVVAVTHVSINDTNQVEVL